MFNLASRKFFSSTKIKNWTPEYLNTPSNEKNALMGWWDMTSSPRSATFPNSSQVTTDGANVLRLEDLSGSGAHMWGAGFVNSSQPHTLENPGLNGLPVIVDNGANHSLGDNEKSFDMKTFQTIAGVWLENATYTYGENSLFKELYNPYGGWVFENNDVLYWNYANVGPTADRTPKDQWKIAVSHMKVDESGYKLAMYLDSQKNEVDDFRFATNPGRNYTVMEKDRETYKIRLGPLFGSGDRKIAELILAKVANESDIERIQGYLAHKWGLTDNLASDHPYKNTPPKVKTETFDWTPRMIADEDLNLSYWFNSDSIVSRQLWNDYYDMDYGVWVNYNPRPTVTSGPNSLDVMYFNGDNYDCCYMMRGALSYFLSNIPGCSVFAVHKPALTSGARHVMEVRRSSSASLLMKIDSGNYVVGGTREDTDTFQGATSTTSASTTDYSIQCGIFDYQNATLKQYVNGELDGELTTFQSTGNSENVSSFTYIGSSPPANTSNNYNFPISNTYNGYIGEIIIFESAVDSDTREKVEGYLAHKFGIESQLPSSHPYKTTKPTIDKLTGYEN